QVRSFFAEELEVVVTLACELNGRDLPRSILRDMPFQVFILVASLTRSQREFSASEVGRAAGSGSQKFPGESVSRDISSRRRCDVGTGEPMRDRVIELTGATALRGELCVDIGYSVIEVLRHVRAPFCGERWIAREVSIVPRGIELCDLHGAPFSYRSSGARR